MKKELKDTRSRSILSPVVERIIVNLFKVLTDMPINIGFAGELNVTWSNELREI